MTPRTLKALRGSIKKWWKIANGRGTDKGTANCPLCDEFFGVIVRGSCCNGCVVRKESHQSGCRRTPYTKWNLYPRKMNKDRGRIFDVKSQLYALDEWLYLNSLMP